MRRFARNDRIVQGAPRDAQRRSSLDPERRPRDDQTLGLSFGICTLLSMTPGFHALFRFMPDWKGLQLDDESQIKNTQ